MSDRELSRQIVVKVARDTASILHTRNDLGISDDCFQPIEEAEFCDEAEALATGEECGCMEPEEAIEGSLMVWVEKQLATRSDAHLLRSHEALKPCPNCHRSDGWHVAEGHPPQPVGDCRKIVWLETPDGMAYWGVRAYSRIGSDGYDIEMGWTANGRAESDIVRYWMEGPHNPAYPPIDAALNVYYRPTHWSPAPPEANQ